MSEDLNIEQLVSPEKLQSFLVNLGKVINKCCAVVRFPNNNEEMKLLKYRKFLRPKNPVTPNKEEEKIIFKELAEIKQSYFDISYGQQTFCKLLRKSKLADLRCIFCNYTNSNIAYRKNKVRIYRCHANLYEMVAPIMAGNRHMGDLFVGQNYNVISEDELKKMHTDFKLTCKFETFKAAYDGLPHNGHENIEVQLKRHSSFLRDLADFLSSYISTNLSNEIFPKLCFGMHMNTEERQVIDMFFNGFREKYITFDSGSVWTENERKPDYIKCLWSDYRGPDKELKQLYKEGMKKDEGLGGKVITDQKRIFLNTRKKIEKILPPDEYKRIRRNRNLGTFLGVPLKVNGRITGFIEIGSHKTNAFRQSTIRMIEEAARYLSLFMAFKSDVKTMFGWLLDYNKDEQFLQMAVQAIPAIIGGAACSIFKVSADRQFLECVATTGIMEINEVKSIHGIRYPINGKSFTAWVFNHDKVNVDSRSIFSEEVDIAPPTFHESIIDPMGKELGKEECGSLSVIAAPLHDENNEKMGVLRIVGKLGSGKFTDNDMKMIENFAEILLSNPTSFLTVFKIGMEMLNQKDVTVIAYQFLTLITHHEGIDINRAMLFSWDQYNSTIDKFMAIGPFDKSDGQKIRSLLSPINTSSESLNNLISNTSEGIALMYDSRLYKDIPVAIPVEQGSKEHILLNKNVLSLIEYDCNETLSGSFKSFLSQIDFNNGLITVLPIDSGKIFFLVCDNLFDHTGTISRRQRHLLKIACEFFIRGESIYSLESQNINLRNEWWKNANDTLRHNLGNNLTILETMLSKISENLKQHIIHGDPPIAEGFDGIYRFRESDNSFSFGDLPLELVRMSKRNIFDLKTFEITIKKDLVRLSSFNNELMHHLRYAGEVPWKIQIYRNLTNNPDILLRIDYERIFDCFDNLINNSFECINENRKVTISCAVIDTDSKEMPKELLIKNRYCRYVMYGFQDNGPGINNDEKHKIFEPYKSGKNGHLGLGLAFIAYVMRKLDGFVMEDGIAGQGVSFKLFLPDVENEITQPPIQIPRNIDRTDNYKYLSNLRKLTDNENQKLLEECRLLKGSECWNMLIVEDDIFMINKIVKRFIMAEHQRKRFAMKSANNFNEYLSLQRDCIYDIIILDLRLFSNKVEGDYDGGLNVSKYSQELNNGVITILFSASLTAKDCVQAMRSGVWDCIDKNEHNCMELLEKSIRKGLESKIGTYEWIAKMKNEFIKGDYYGKYIAMVNGAIVGSDTDLDNLRLKVDNKLLKNALNFEMESMVHPDNTIVYVQIPSHEEL